MPVNGSAGPDDVPEDDRIRYRRRANNRAGRRWTLPTVTTLIALVSALVVSGCSTKAEDTAASAPAGQGAVRTDVGVTADTITLGLLTDTTGPFAALGKDVTFGQQVYWDAKNTAGKVCGRYKVELEIADHGYNVQKVTTQYSAMRKNVLALNQVLGSPMASALAPDLVKDNVLTIPMAWALNLADSPAFALTGPTYDIETINGLDFLLEQGLIKKGGPIGHIFHDSEYGANALLGTKYFARQHGMTVVEQRISALEGDLSSRVTALRAAGVQAIVLTTSPPQAAVAASATEAAGLRVPLLGNSPTFQPSLLNTPARDVLINRFYHSGPNTSLGVPQTKAIAEAIAAERPNGAFSNGVVTGYVAARIMDAILTKGCENGDLTRAGVIAAKRSLNNVGTDGLTGTLDYTQLGVSPSKQNFIARPDADAPAASVIVATLYEGPTAKAYKRGA
ncbi:Peripla_BP_6 domain-containing protein [Frankia sp. Hr75.2]|nr:Peripla_BP_6 domain-containing protein [Frankia sp. Hr75.2]